MRFAPLSKCMECMIPPYGYLTTCVWRKLASGSFLFLAGFEVGGEVAFFHLCYELFLESMELHFFFYQV